MKSRTLIATIGTVAALCIVGWMIYDGTTKLLKSRLHELSCSQISRQVPFKKNTAAKVQAQPIVSNAAKSQALLKIRSCQKRLLPIRINQRN